MSGFERHKRRWYRAGPDVLAVLALEREHGTGATHLRQGFRFMRTGDDPWPNVDRCDIVLRVEQLVDFDARTLALLFDKRSDLSVVDRITGFQALIQDALLPVIDEAGTTEGLQRLWRAGRLPDTAVRPAARVRLEAPVRERSVPPRRTKPPARSQRPPASGLPPLPALNDFDDVAVDAQGALTAQQRK